MIVSRGLGRKGNAAAGIIVATGLGLVLAPSIGGGIPAVPRIAAETASATYQLILDEADLLDIVPILVEVLNGRR